MALTPSTMLALKTRAPQFSLPDVVTGKAVSLDGFSSKKAMLVMFICRHCPYVKHIEKEIAKIGQDYKNKDLGIVAISANDADHYPDDNPRGLKQMAEKLKLSFPLCFDETQETAKAYHAACTPDFFVFDAKRELVYRGQLDDSRPENGKPVTGKDLRQALDAVLQDRQPDSKQVPSMGCNIKWKAGNEPAYFN